MLLIRTQNPAGSPAQEIYMGVLHCAQEIDVGVLNCVSSIARATTIQVRTRDQAVRISSDAGASGHASDIIY